MQPSLPAFVLMSTCRQTASPHAVDRGVRRRDRPLLLLQHGHRRELLRVAILDSARLAAWLLVCGYPSSFLACQDASRMSNHGARTTALLRMHIYIHASAPAPCAGAAQPVCAAGSEAASAHVL